MKSLFAKKHNFWGVDDVAYPDWCITLRFLKNWLILQWTLIDTWVVPFWLPDLLLINIERTNFVSIFWISFGLTLLLKYLLNDLRMHDSVPADHKVLDALSRRSFLCECILLVLVVLFDACCDVEFLNLWFVGVLCVLGIFWLTPPLPSLIVTSLSVKLLLVTIKKLSDICIFNFLLSFLGI